MHDRDMQRAVRPKRSRALQACEICRTRKNRCNEEQPCTYCVEHDLECVYSRPQRAKRRQADQTPSRGSQLEDVPLSGTESHASNASTYQADPEGNAKAVGDRFLFNNDAQFSAQLSPVGTGWDGQQQRAVTPISLTSGQPGPSVTTHDPAMSQQSAATSRETGADVMDKNTHTRNLEFYGAASSVAFLRHVENISGGRTSEHMAAQAEQSLASLLHNTEFVPHSTPGTMTESRDGSNDRFYFRVARKFIDAYFSNIHFIQPVLDEDAFLTRCEDLWFDKAGKQPLSFRALYHAVLSLGSLVMVWDDDEIQGADRFSWSRRFFNEAVAIVTQLGSGTDIEMVQCYYMMGKVCQHELNPHVAYLYSGQATRIALAIGLNRLAYGPASDPRSSVTAAKTWWAVYCLDIQTSFALGRPDSLGPDEYHTQDIPGAVSDSSAVTTDPLRIVPLMVTLSRIMRRVSLQLYTVPCEVRERVARAREVDAELTSWLQSLPSHFQTSSTPRRMSSLKSRRLTSHIHKQHVVLMIRYYNLRMVVYGKFLTNSAEVEGEMAPMIRECQQHCIASAGQAIDLIHETFRNMDFFQTWWYNSTYTLFAVSVLLTAVFHRFVDDSRTLDSLLGQIQRAIAVLEAMDECVVARNATLIVKRTLARAEKMSQAVAAKQPNLPAEAGHVWQQTHIFTDPAAYSTEASDALGETMVGMTADVDFNWTDTPFPIIDDGQQALFWTEWAHLLEDLSG